MDRTAKITGVGAAGRITKMRVSVTESARESTFSRTAYAIKEAMQRSCEAEFETRRHRMYRNRLSV